MKIGKRGVSAVEMIISFMIFLGFLTFIFVYMNPLGTRATIITNEAISSEIGDYAMVWLGTVGVASDSGPCFIIKNPLNGTAFVEDSNGIKVKSKMDGNSIEIEGGKMFYRIINGDIIENSSLGGCREGNYSLSVMGTEKAYSYWRLSDMNRTYYSNYNSLKSVLRVPVARNFALTIFDSSRGKMFEMQRTIPRTQMVSSEYPIEILKDNQILKGALRILQW